MEASNTRRPSVLIVEDDADVREVLADAVESTGRYVLTASDGAQALEVLGKAPRPCLIVLDLNMWPMRGEEFLRALLARSDASEFSVLVSSASGKVSFPVSSPMVVGYLRKPFNLEQLARVLDEHC